MHKKIQFGHTAITWDNTEIETAVAAIAAAGYWGTETFGWVLEQWARDGKDLKAVFDRHELELTSLYVHMDLIDPHKREQEMEQVMRWVDLYTAYESPVVVLGSKPVDRRAFDLHQHVHTVVQTLNTTAAIIRERGKICCFHPHTGTAVETETEIGMVMDAVDVDVVRFAPDCGQIGKGGADPLRIIQDYHDIIGMVHLKDYIGGPIEYSADGKEIDKTGYLGYTPLGEGALDIAGMVRYLEQIDYDGYASVELDGNQWSPIRIEDAIVPQQEALAISKRFLQNLGYSFKTE